MKEKIEFENSNFNENRKYDRKKTIISRFVLGLMIIAILIVIVVIIVKRKNIDDTLYEAKNSDYEVYCESKAYIVNNETIVDYDSTSTIITLAESTKRIAINDVIAIYKTEQYDNNKLKLKELDDKINEKLLSMPTTYSNEIVQVENEIDDVIQKIKNTSSYIKINEYKAKLDELSYKKAKILASLNPSAVELLSLISERDSFKKNMNSSLKNIVAKVSGVVIYKQDGLENKFNTEDFNLNKINEIKKAYDGTLEETFGIKIVDNFESFLIIEENINNKGYMKEGVNYSIELLSKDVTLKGQLMHIINTEDEEKLYCVFRVTNGVENLVETRTTDIKVVWKNYSGFWVNNTSITTKDEIVYVTILSLNEYIDIPVKVITTLEDKTLVKNYTKSELDELGIERDRSLLLYDRIVKDVSQIQR